MEIPDIFNGGARTTGWPSKWPVCRVDSLILHWSAIPTIVPADAMYVGKPPIFAGYIPTTFFFWAHPIQLKLGGIVKRAGSFGQIGEYGIVYGMGFTTWLPLSAGYSGDICPMSRSSKAGLVRCQAKSVSSLHFDCSMTQWLCYEDPVFFWRVRLVGLPFFGW